ncbi:MAG: AraC family ligand binding domain-containing protein [Vicinamibacterales bacterium]
MINIAMLVWTLVFAQGAAQASGTFVGKAALDEALKKALAAASGNIIDQKISSTDIEGGKAHVAHLRRVQAETNALIHDHVTEIYYILEGAGTMQTGGRIEGIKETDLTNLGAGISHTGTHVGGSTQRVAPGDVFVVPAGMAHRFSQLDGPIRYVVFRFEPGK